MIKLIKEGYDDTYYEVVSEVDGIPNTIVRKDDDVKFRVVRRDNKNGYQIKAMWYDKDQKMGQWDYSKEYYDTPEEASDAMTKFTATFRNLPNKKVQKESRQLNNYTLSNAYIIEEYLKDIGKQVSAIKAMINGDNVDADLEDAVRETCSKLKDIIDDLDVFV